MKKKNQVEQKEKLPLVKENKTIPTVDIKNDLMEDMIQPNEVYDEGDLASALELGFLAQTIARHQEKMKPETHPDFDGEHCIDCDIEIPEQRLAMHKIRCVDCQELLERKRKLKGY